MSFIVDSYSEANQDDFILMGLARTKQVSQSFTAVDSVLDSCKFNLKKYGSATGNAYACIYAHTGTFGTSSGPTGSVLATSDVFDVSSLTTDFQLISFAFSGNNKIKLTNGTKYCLLFVYNGSGSTLNYLVIGTDENSPTHTGNAAFNSQEYEDPISEEDWQVESGWDLIFYVYAEKTGPFPTHFRQ